MPQERQQPQRGRTGRPLVARAVRGVALVGGLALLPLATACGGGTDRSADDKPSETSAMSAPSAGVVAPAKVEVIADLTGCKVKIRTDADELREGVCDTADGDYLITTFPAEKYKLTWLDSASMYGGKYLVGPQWAISAKPKMLETLRTKVGGTIEDLDAARTAAPGPKAS
ncbi:hypothetical protein ACFW9L_17655 [Streptomyces sp. NPDC059517]|uniref:hypothetical protein n=1 Tax=Streptomyces sp. NPDC059517 TaxID=3346855 RepID=UPI0036B55BEF